MSVKKISKTKIISTYAQSLYEAAEENKVTEKVAKDVDVLRKILADDPQIITDLSNQIWKTGSKLQAISEISKKLGLTEEMKSCLNLLAENGRMAELLPVLDAFKHTYYQCHDIEEVEVLTVKSLSEAQDKKLKASLEKKLAKKVLITYTIKPELLGGLVVKYGSSMIDDSISGKLTRLEIMMKGGQ